MLFTPLLSPLYRRPAHNAGRRYLFSKEEFADRQSILPLKTVAVLFARKRSTYGRFDLAEIWDEARDARKFTYDLPVVAHPPCRGWGRLRQFAKTKPHELDLALFAVDAVRRCGGVLEHPAHSTLWDASGLPLPGSRDEYGGFTLPIYQSWFGHRAPKPTWLYIVGHEMDTLPAIPYDLGIPDGRIENMGRAERESTPFELATWLLKVAQLSTPKMSGSYVTPGQTATGGSRAQKNTPGQTLTGEQNHD